MHISRIRVPEFRVLKDIDISFEKEFIPRIFPLGSQNGGGKSTLLQLIFVLLHCSTDPDKIPYLQNMLQGFKIPEGSDQRLLASFDVWDGQNTNTIEFICCKNSFFIDLFPNLKDQKDKFMFEFSKLQKEYKRLKLKINQIKEEVQSLEIFLNELKELNATRSEREQEKLLKDLIQDFKFRQLRFLRSFNISSFDEFQKKCQEVLESLIINRHKTNREIGSIEQNLHRFEEYLHEKNLIYICSYSSDNNINSEDDEDDLLLCNMNLINSNQIEDFFKTLSPKIFLAAPASQVFLFLSKTARKILFKDTMIGNNYTSEVQQAKSKLSGFFTYDFVAVSLLTESFKSARDKDFAKAIETNGQYGNSYQTLVNDLHLILGNKKVIPIKELSGVNFKLDNNDNIELYPEDLSHGELKRLSIYIWLKYHNIEDAIVLMDEIEIAFHPDWQYQIISDIQEWAPNNQYILATHSYELCQALTPSHVKEIEPKLLKQNPIN